MAFVLSGPQQLVLLSAMLLWVQLLRCEARPQPSDLFKQIDKDLHNFRNGVSIGMVEQVYCSNNDQGANRCAYQQLWCQAMLLLQCLQPP